MAVTPTVRRKEDDAVADTPPAIIEPPFAFFVQTNQRLDPVIAPIEIGPLVGEAQMDLDDARGDGLEIDDAGVAAQMRAAPCAGPVLDRRLGLRADLPIVERALRA